MHQYHIFILAEQKNRLFIRKQLKRLHLDAHRLHFFCSCESTLTDTENEDGQRLLLKYTRPGTPTHIFPAQLMVALICATYASTTNMRQNFIFKTKRENSRRF